MTSIRENRDREERTEQLGRCGCVSTRLQIVDRGTTGYGGAGGCKLGGGLVGCGTVFELSPPQQQGGTWTETVLYSLQGDTDGYFPAGDLIFDKQGNIYGATQFGGGFGDCNPFYGFCGTVYKLIRPKTKGDVWTEEVLHSFRGTDLDTLTGDGANPNGGLIFDSKGAIYGTTFRGGSSVPICGNTAPLGCGTVFKLVPPQEKGERGPSRSFTSLLDPTVVVRTLAWLST
jgi:uncharacterized protein YceK